jgi:hypothetical protein
MLFKWKSRDAGTILSKMDQSPNLYPSYMLENGIAPSECKETAKMLGLGYAGDGEICAGPGERPQIARPLLGRRDVAEELVARHRGYGLQS